MTEYSHPEHGEMERYQVDQHGVEIDGYRCTVCHVAADKDEADEVFDEHDCEHYKNLQKNITGNL